MNHLPIWLMTVHVLHEPLLTFFPQQCGPPSSVPWSRLQVEVLMSVPQVHAFFSRTRWGGASGANALSLC